jgi:hydroxymethylbilane synthase
MKKTWTVGTRGSKLALRQTQMVVDALREANPGHEFPIRTIRTTGDTVWDRPLAQIGGKGLFVKEIEEELVHGGIDIAVHSMKDLPAELAAGLVIGAVMVREDPRDAFVSTRLTSISELHGGNRVGTGSTRRKAQLRRYCDGVQVVPLRGNVDTRLRKLTEERLDGIILAAAGIRRLGLEQVITEIIPSDIMVPTAGQGAIGIEIRRGDEAAGLLGSLNHERTHREIAMERAVQGAVGGGCSIPLGIHARIEDDGIDLSLSLGNEDGVILVHEKLSGKPGGEQALIEKASRILLEHMDTGYRL